jgi:hypothetical protein
VAFNPTAVAFPLPEDILGSCEVVLSSFHGHSDQATIPSNSTLWLRVKH